MAHVVECECECGSVCTDLLNLNVSHQEQYVISLPPP